MFKDLFKEVPGLGVGQGQGRLVVWGYSCPRHITRKGERREEAPAIETEVLIVKLDFEVPC